MAVTLEVVLNAKDNASGKLAKVSGAAGKLGSAAGTAIRAGALAGGAAIAGLGVASVKMAADFDKSMAEVKTLLPDISEKGFGKLKEGVIDLSKEMGIATSEAVPALYQAISAGVPPDNAIDFMRTASKASIGGVTDLETAVDGITSVVNAYGSDAISAGKASDIMFTAVKLGKTTFDELSASLFNTVPIAAASGVKFEEVGAALAALTAQGVPTSVATTQLRAAIQSLTAPTVRQKKLVNELGLDFSVASLKQKGLSGAMKEAVDATGGNMEQLRKLFGSVEAVQAVLALGGKQSGKFTDALDEMGGSTGASEAAFEEMAKTTSFKFNKAMNLLRVTLMQVGLKILPLLTRALEKVTPWLEQNLPVAMRKVERFVQQARPTVEKLFGTFMEGLRVVAPLVEKFVMFVVTNKPVLIAAIVAIGAAIVLSFGPVATAMVALTGLILVVGLISQRWRKWKDAMVGFLKSMVNGIKKPVLALLDFLKKHWKKIVLVALAILFPPGAGLFLLITKFGAIRDAVKGVINKLLGFLKTAWVTLRDTAINVLFGAGKGLWKLAGKAKEVADKVLDWFKGIPTRLRNNLTRFFNAAKDLGKELLKGLQKGIASSVGIAGDIASSVVSALKSIINTQIIDPINRAVEIKIGMPGPIPDVNVNPPDIPHLAQGGIVRRTGLAIVDKGERFLGAGSAAVPAGVTVNLTINTPFNLMSHTDRVRAATAIKEMLRGSLP